MPPRHALPWALAIASGLGQAVSLAAPWDGQPRWWLQLLSLAVLAWLLSAGPANARARPMRRAALLSGLHATAWLAGTFWWLFISMHVYAGLAPPLAALAVLALACTLALYYAAAGAAFSWLFPPRVKASWAWRAIVFAALWTLAELARASWLTGFPWGAIGYAHIDGPLEGIAPLLGVYGLGAAAALLAAAAAAVLRQPSARAGAGLLALATAVPGAAWLGGTAREASMTTAAAPPLTVALLQGNIAQDQKFQGATGVPLALHWYGQQLREARASLVVTPETALPLLPRELPEGYWEALQARFAQGGQAALLGLPLGSHRLGYTNSVAGLKPGQAKPYQYDKHHLVPFGEFVPPLFRWFTRMMNIPLGDFNRGAVNQPSFEWQGQRLAPNICYEDLFGEELGVRFRRADEAPTVFVNLSNVAWFGDSTAIDQHLLISRMRALEFQRPMLRATNTGATALIDHRGRVRQMLPRLTRGVLLGEVEGRQGLTPYAAWVARLGLWPLWGAALLVAALAAFLARRARRCQPGCGRA